MNQKEQMLAKIFDDHLTYKEACELIDGWAHAVHFNRWKKLADSRRPFEDEDVIIVTNSGDVLFARYKWKQGDQLTPGWFIRGGVLPDSEVAYWTQQPAPPKQQSF